MEITGNVDDCDNDDNEKVTGSFYCIKGAVSVGGGCDETKVSDWLFGLWDLLLTKGGTCEQPLIVLRNDASNRGLFTFL